MHSSTPLGSADLTCLRTEKIEIIAPNIGGRAREHDVVRARNIMSNHTDMQDKYCGHSNDIHPIQSQYTKGAAASTKGVPRPYGRRTFCCGFLCIGFEWGESGTTTLVLQVDVIGHHDSCNYNFVFLRRSDHARLRAKGSKGPCPPAAGSGGDLGPAPIVCEFKR